MNLIIYLLVITFVHIQIVQMILNIPVGKIKKNLLIKT
jgi:hypothetical protein